MNTIPQWLHACKVSAHPQEAAWLSDFRQRHWDAFLKNGMPTRKEERWKYTDLAFLANKNFSAAVDYRKAKKADADHLHHVINKHRLQCGDSILLVFVNGYFMPVLSDTAKLPPSVIACSLGAAFQQHAELIKKYWPANTDTQKYPFANLNAAVFADGLFLSLSDKCELSMPIHLLSLAAGECEFAAHPHHFIILGEHSKLPLIEEYIALSDLSYIMNIVTTITVGKHARLEHVKIQNEGVRAVHMANTFVQQKQDSNVTFTNFSVGSTFSRDDVVVKLLETGADCKTSGFYHLRYDNQYIDHHIDIDHAAPRSNSEMLYKGILDKKSRAVFNGRLYVEKDAQKILAYQANHNLLLSNDAEVYSKPELEIYADDVKCKHGASTGQIDQEALFYLRSRGVDKTEAMRILLEGFAEEIMQHVTHPGVKMRVQEMLSCQ